MEKLLLCSNTDCPIMQTCVRAMKPLNDSEYVYADFTYQPNFGCTAYIQRKSRLNNIYTTPKTSQMETQTTNTTDKSGEKSKKDKNERKNHKPRTRSKCAYCKKGFLARTNQDCCSPQCSKNYYYERKKAGLINKSDDAPVVKRGRPRKIKNKKPIQSYSEWLSDGIVNNNTKYLLHAVIESDTQANLVKALFKSALPNVEIKIVKL